MIHARNREKYVQITDIKTRKNDIYTIESYDLFQDEIKEIENLLAKLKKKIKSKTKS